MQAVILAGGKGTRLQNILKGKPKCLAPVGESTILEHQIKEISKSKIKDILIIVNPNDLNIFRNLLGNGSRFGVNIT